MRELSLILIKQSLTEIKIVILGTLHKLDIAKISTRFASVEKSHRGGEAHVLVVVHGRAKKIVRDVQSKVAGAFVGVRNGAGDVLILASSMVTVGELGSPG